VVQNYDSSISLTVTIIKCFSLDPTCTALMDQLLMTFLHEREHVCARSNAGFWLRCCVLGAQQSFDALEFEADNATRR